MGPGIPTSLNSKDNIRRPPRAVTTEPIPEAELTRLRRQALQEHRPRVGLLLLVQVCITE